MSLGRRISEIRQSKELTQREVSRKTGLAVPYLSRIENDHIEPSFTTLNKVAAALDVNLIDFFGYEPRKRFRERCPISLSGRCIMDHIYKSTVKQVKLDPEQYSAKQIQLLKLVNYLILFGNQRVHETLEFLLTSMVKSPSVRKDRRWMSALNVGTAKKRR